MSSVSDRNGVHHRDHSCPDSGGVHSRHSHHHVLLLRGAAEEGEDRLEITLEKNLCGAALEGADGQENLVFAAERTKLLKQWISLFSSSLLSFVSLSQSSLFIGVMIERQRKMKSVKVSTKASANKYLCTE